jgi:lambda family phage portal protein
MSGWRLDSDLANLNARIGAVRNYGAYTGAAQSEWDSRWSTFEQHPDAALSGDLEVMRARSQDLHRNSPIVAGATQALVTGSVGRGIRPRSRAVTGRGPEADAELRAYLDARFAAWEPTACIDGTTGFYDLQALAAHAVIRDGDVLAIWPDDSGRLAVDLIAASRIVTPSDAGTLDIRHGVEWRNRKVAGWWVVTSEGARATKAESYRFVPDRGGRINARMIRRPMSGMLGASRTPPLIGPAIGRIKDCETYDQAERRANIARSKITGVLTAPDPEKIERAWNNAQTGNTIAQQYQSRSFGTLFDAQIMSLATGEQMTLFNPQTSNPVYAAYIETALKQIAMCYGLPWSIAFQLLDKINYSNARTNKTAARRTFELWQRELIAKLCRPTWDLFVRYEFAAGNIPVEAVTPELLACDWRADVERWVDPAKEIKAATDAMAAGIASHYSVCADLGEDADEMLAQEIEYHVKRKAAMEAAGLDDWDMGYAPRETMSRSENETETTTTTEVDGE